MGSGISLGRRPSARTSGYHCHFIPVTWACMPLSVGRTAHTCRAHLWIACFRGYLPTCLKVEPQCYVQRAHCRYAGHPAEVLRVDRGGHAGVIGVVENVVGVDAEPAALPFSRENVKKRPSDILKVTEPGPVIVLRPAVPSSPEAGSANAPMLKNSKVVRSERGRLTGRPAASGRSEANTPEPLLLDWLPATAAVKGKPVCKVVTPLSCQLPMIRSPSRRGSENGAAHQRAVRRCD